jgi:hypothetical protein
VFDLFVDLTLVEGEEKVFDAPRKNLNGMVCLWKMLFATTTVQLVDACPISPKVTNWQNDSELSKGRRSFVLPGDPDDPLTEDIRGCAWSACLAFGKS